MQILQQKKLNNILTGYISANEYCQDPFHVRVFNVNFADK